MQPDPLFTLLHSTVTKDFRQGKWYITESVKMFSPCAAREMTDNMNYIIFKKGTTPLIHKENEFSKSQSFVVGLILVTHS